MDGPEQQDLLATEGGVAEEGSRTSGGVSRRAVLTGAGVAVATGVAAATAGAAVLPGVAAATGGGSVATGPSGTSVMEFVAQIGQSDADFTAYGFLSQVDGLSATDLFSPPADPNKVATALFTAAATGKLVSRSVDDTSTVHSLDIVGQLAVYQRSTPGASFGDPSSFTSGRRVATYSVVFQDILTVIAPNTGVPTLVGDVRQLEAGYVSGGRQFGARGLRLRFYATGLGMRSQAAPPVASLTVAGNLSVE
jgi:hypothetical protein